MFKHLFNFNGSQIKTRKWGQLILLMTLLVACSSPPTEIPTDQPADMDTYVDNLENWPAAVEAPVEVPLTADGEPTEDGTPEPVANPSTEIGSDGKDYTCTTTNYSLTNAPQEIVTFDPDISLLWPGAILQGKGIQAGLGSLRQVGVRATDRPALVVSIPRILSGDSRRIVPNPSLSNVNNAVGELIQVAQNADIETGRKIDFTLQESHGQKQSALNFNLAVEYLTGEAEATLNTQRKSDEHTLTAYFVENAFTVTVDLEGQDPQEALFGNSFSASDLAALERDGQIGDDNLPTFVASVTYGRVLMFSVTSSAEYRAIEGAIEGMYDFGTGSVSGGISASEQELLEQSEVKVTSIGGPFRATAGLIESGDLGEFFKIDPELETMVPIAYEVRTVKNNDIAAVDRTTEYNIRECLQVPEGPQKKSVTVTFDRLTSNNDCDTFTSENNLRGSLYAFGQKVGSFNSDLKKGEGTDLSGSLQRIVSNEQGDSFTVAFYAVEDDSGLEGGDDVLGTKTDRFYAPHSGGFQSKTLSGAGCSITVSYRINVSDVAP